MSRFVANPMTGPNFKAAPKPKRKGMRPVSKRKADHRASVFGQTGLEYMGLVKTLPCAACGSTSRPRDAHHCKDKPPYGEDGPYQKSPHRFVRTGDFDTIPLCKDTCHNIGPHSFHMDRRAWNEKHGPDYGYILPTRAAVQALGGTIDF